MWFFIRYLITYFFFRFNFYRFIKFFNSLRKKEIGVFVQDGFGDVLFGYFVYSYLTKMGFKIKIGLQSIGCSSDPNMNFNRTSNKKIAFGNYTEILLSKLGVTNVYSGLDFYDLGFLYCEFRFFKKLPFFFLSKIAIDKNHSENKFQFPSKRYFTIHLRNNCDDLLYLFSELIKNELLFLNYDCYVFKEPDFKLPQYSFPERIIDASSFDFESKLILLGNSSFSLAGRGGFSTFPLFCGIECFNFFDAQGFSEMDSGLIEYSFWSHCNFKGPINNVPISDVIKYINKKYVSG